MVVQWCNVAPAVLCFWLSPTSDFWSLIVQDAKGNHVDQPSRLLSQLKVPLQITCPDQCPPTAAESALRLEIPAQCPISLFVPDIPPLLYTSPEHLSLGVNTEMRLLGAQGSFSCMLYDASVQYLMVVRSGESSPLYWGLDDTDSSMLLIASVKANLTEFPSGCAFEVSILRT